jgi:hypothetical protein
MQVFTIRVLWGSIGNIGRTPPAEIIFRHLVEHGCRGGPSTCANRDESKHRMPR